MGNHAITSDAPVSAAVLEQRRTLVFEAESTARAVLGGFRPPPTLAFLAAGTGTPTAEYDHDTNTITVRENGYLDNPAVTHRAIAALISHEIGHWADSRLETRTRLSKLPGIMGLVVLVAGCALVFWTLEVPPAPLVGHNGVVVAALLIATLSAYLGIFVSAAIRHRSEFVADAAAVRVCGPDAVVEMLQFPAGRAPTYTHPRSTTRIRRIERSTQKQRGA